MIARTRISILQIQVHKYAKPLSSVCSVPPRGFSTAQTTETEPSKWRVVGAPKAPPIRGQAVSPSQQSLADQFFQTTNLIARHLRFHRATGLKISSDSPANEEFGLLSDPIPARWIRS